MVVWGVCSEDGAGVVEAEVERYELVVPGAGEARVAVDCEHVVLAREELSREVARHDRSAGVRWVYVKLSHLSGARDEGSIQALLRRY